MDKDLVKKAIRTGVCLVCFFALFIADKIVVINDSVRLALYGVIYLAAAYDVLWKAIRNICHGKVFDENFLMTVASLGAFALGIVKMTKGEHGDFAESVAVILFYQVGEIFQDYAVGKSRKSIASLMDIRPDQARVFRDGKWVEVYPEEVSVGEIVQVHAGEKIPLDGVVINGNTNLNTCALTGESVPVFVEEGSSAMSGTIVLDGSIDIKVEKEFYDSTVSKILDMVENASGKKAKTENFISVFAKYYTPFVVFTALALAIIPPAIISVVNAASDGAVWASWIERALTCLVVSCPCALVISIPLGFFGGIGGASSKGILIKGANYIEQLEKVNAVVFDKTGTLTTGEFKVSKVFPEDRREEVLKAAYICEYKSTHPIAKSIVAEGVGEEDESYAITEVAGKGIVAEKDGERLACGNAKLMLAENVKIEEADFSGTTVYVAKNGEYLGAICVSDVVKPDAKRVIDGLKEQKTKVVMLTGDNERAASPVAKELGIEDYKSGLLPQDKLAEVDKLISRKDKNDVIAFVGDGINDAPVLMRADVGISMGQVGSDSAIEASDVVLMHDRLSDIVTAKKIAKKTMRIVRENIIFSLGVKAVALILGAIGIPNMMWIAVFADVGVAMIAILNAMRALRIK